MTRIFKAPRLADQSLLVGSVPPPPPPPSPEEVPQADPNLEAELLLAEARREAEVIRRQAFDEGYREGQETALKELQQEWDQAFGKMLREVEGVLAQRSLYLQQAEEDLLRLACLIAAKVLRHEVKHDPSYLQDLIQASLEKLVGRSQIKLFLNALDFERFQSGLLVTEHPIAPILDPTLWTGGCRVETECGRADASFHSQFEAIVQALLPEPGIAEKAIESLHEPPAV